MRDRHGMGDDSGYSGFIFMMVVIGLPVLATLLFAAIGIIVTN
jgi:hypothetical protein